MFTRVVLFLIRHMGKKALLVLLAALMLAAPAQVKANDDWDHMGTTFAIQTLSYGISSYVLNIGYHQTCIKWDPTAHDCEWSARKSHHRTEAVIFSGILTAVGTFAYSYLKTMNGQPMPWREIGMNAIGQATAIGAIYVFHF